MQLHRLLAAGLLGVYLCLVWREVMGPPRVAVQVEYPAAVAEPPGACPAPTPRPSVNVVDVAAAAATPELVAQLIRLAEGEQITAVDDRSVAGDLAAGAWISARFQPGTIGTDGIARDLPPPTAGVPDLGRRGPIRSGDYIDLAIEGEAGSRRVLVLFH